MDIEKGDIDISSRLSDEKQENVCHIVQEIYNMIHDVFQQKEQDVYDYIAINIEKIIKKKKTISLTIPKTSKEISYTDISQLSTGDLVDGVLKIIIVDDVIIEYKCISADVFISNIIARIPNGNRINMSIKDTQKQLICKLSTKNKRSKLFWNDF